MKNKSKKILAGIGLGVISALSLTGCSMSDEQREALDKVVSKADQIIELVENQNKELSNAEAVRLYEFAKTRLLVNKDDVWDNMKMTISQDSSEEGLSDYEGVRGEQHFYKFADGKRVAYGKLDAGEDVGEIDGWFSEVVPEEESTDPEGSGNVTTITQVTTYSYYAGYYATAIIQGVDILESNIVDCDILENGNYYITASLMYVSDAIDDEEFPMLVEIELTPDGYLISHTSNLLIGHLDAQFNKYVLTTVVKYEYGTLNDSIVQSNIDAYIAQESVDN